MLSQYLLLALKNISRDNLRYFIENNVDLLDFIKNNYANQIEVARAFLELDSDSKKTIRAELDTAKPIDILQIIKTNRPDLYEEIGASAQGVVWLSQLNLQKFKYLLNL
jgi:hypothetical protein